LLKRDPQVSDAKLKKLESDIKDLNITEKTLFENLTYEPVHIDILNESTGLSISECLVNLLSLEFKNLVRQMPGKKFMRV